MAPAEDAPQRLALRHAVALGVLQGPAELLPISSSAHTSLLPWLAGWPYAGLDGELRKSFEVALHAGAGLALALHMRDRLRRDLACLDRRGTIALALALVPPALAGQLLEGPIERRLGGPRSIAAGLLAGALAMAIADRRAGTRAGGERAVTDVGAVDGLALGVAQAVALAPGVSRNGATLAVARARGFERDAAQSLSWHVGLPVLFGASALKGARLRRGGHTRAQHAALAAGAASAFLSTLVGARLLHGGMRGGRALLPYSLYRCALAALVVSRLRRGTPPSLRAQ